MSFFRILFVLIFFSNLLISQSTSSIADSLSEGNQIYLRLYGELVYNHKIDPIQRLNGVLDARRIVLMTGYQFNSNLQFVSEIEFEHANEVFVEQAFLKYHLSTAFNLRAGLLIVPSGIVNADHEPTNFYTTDRPEVDRVVVPSTWREMGIGFSGLLTEYSLKYQAYFVNGLLSFDDSGLLSGQNGLRKGRQKGIKSTLSTWPSLATQFEYFGIDQLKIGASLYSGTTQSTAYDGILKNDKDALHHADSTVVKVNLVSLHANYNLGRVRLRGQWSMAFLGNTLAYNQLTSQDIGSKVNGYYLNAAYRLVDQQHKLDAFSQMEKINTQQKIAGGAESNPLYDRSIYTVGLNWFPSGGAVVKMDYQWHRNAAQQNFQQFNTGVGVWF